MNLKIKEIKPGTEEYRLELELRTRILRAPLGLNYSTADISEETNDIHLGAFDGEQIVGCLLLRPVDAQLLKMRQVAVSHEYQGKGIGKQLVLASEEVARGIGVTELHLHARETAVLFYRKLGYEVYGSPFLEVSIPHRKMRKSL